MRGHNQLLTLLTAGSVSLLLCGSPFAEASTQAPPPTTQAESAQAPTPVQAESARVLTPTASVSCVQAALSDVAQPIPWTNSISRGLPYRGSLANPTLLPAEGRSFVTWDPGIKASPSRAWRRNGAAHAIASTLCATAMYKASHPNDPRILIGDISLPNGGVFSRDYGGLGHASHQNGLDIDVYYPRIDRIEGVATSINLIDRERAQQLINQFVAAGAVKVFIGRTTGLVPPPTPNGAPHPVVQRIAKHEDHLHVRFPASMPPTPTTPATPVPAPTPPTNTPPALANATPMAGPFPGS